MGKIPKKRFRVVQGDIVRTMPENSPSALAVVMDVEVEVDRKTGELRTDICLENQKEGVVVSAEDLKKAFDDGRAKFVTRSELEEE